MTRRTLSPEESRAWARVAATVKPIGPRAADLEELSAALESGRTELDATPAPATAKAKKPVAPKTTAPLAERSSEKKVRRGELIGLIGKTGNAQSKFMEPHLHFEVRSRGAAVDPGRLMR